jgi:hypothetical protein
VQFSHPAKNELIRASVPLLTGALQQFPPNENAIIEEAKLRFIPLLQ